MTSPSIRSSPYTLSSLRTESFSELSLQYHESENSFLAHFQFVEEVRESLPRIFGWKKKESDSLSELKTCLEKIEAIESIIKERGNTAFFKKRPEISSTIVRFELERLRKKCDQTFTEIFGADSLVANKEKLMLRREALPISKREEQKRCFTRRSSSIDGDQDGADIACLRWSSTPSWKLHDYRYTKKDFECMSNVDLYKIFMAVIHDIHFERRNLLLHIDGHRYKLNMNLPLLYAHTNVAPPKYTSPDRKHNEIKRQCKLYLEKIKELLGALDAINTIFKNRRVDLGYNDRYEDTKSKIEDLKIHIPEEIFTDVFETQVAPYSQLEGERGKQDTIVATMAKFFNLAEEQHEVNCFPQPASSGHRVQLGFEQENCYQRQLCVNTPQNLILTTCQDLLAMPALTHPTYIYLRDDEREVSYYEPYTAWVADKRFAELANYERAYSGITVQIHYPNNNPCTMIGLKKSPQQFNDEWAEFKKVNPDGTPLKNMRFDVPDIRDLTFGMIQDEVKKQMRINGRWRMYDANFNAFHTPSLKDLIEHYRFSEKFALECDWFIFFHRPVNEDEVDFENDPFFKNLNEFHYRKGNQTEEELLKELEQKEDEYRRLMSRERVTILEENRISSQIPVIEAALRAKQRENGTIPFNDTYLQKKCELKRQFDQTHPPKSYFNISPECVYKGTKEIQTIGEGVLSTFQKYSQQLSQEISAIWNYW